jgi:DNA-directed RNA polymerase
LNGKLFYLGLGKNKLNVKNIKYVRDIKFNTTKFIKSINYLQKVAYEIDNQLLNYIKNNLVIIKEKIYGQNITKKDIDLLRNQLLEEKNNLDLKNLYDEKLSIFSKLNKLDKELDVCFTYSKYSEFYFVYNVDFRGRIYVFSEHINYQTSTFIRGILKFKKKCKINLQESF